MNAQQASGPATGGEAGPVNNASGTTKGFQLLHELPAGHELRRRPLLGAQCRNLRSGVWREIARSWGIASATYDQLGEAWTSTTEFRVAIVDPGRESDSAEQLSRDGGT